MLGKEPIQSEVSRQDGLYEEVAASYGAPLDRLAHAYEADPDQRRDLLQEIHIALWRSLENFGERCSLRTWVYRVAHNVATSHIVRQRRYNSRTFVSLDVLDAAGAGEDGEFTANRSIALERLWALIQQLKPLDRQVILLYLEGVDAASIGEITGVSPGNIATKIHRIKNVMAHRVQKGEIHGERNSQ
jgi:RNA polymerase sigma-70 factor, ECF subfamily